MAPEAGLIGQARARRALRLGLEIKHAGYNVYVSGDAGTGKLAAVRQVAAQLQDAEARPPDLCYVYGFKNPERPRLLVLPAGRGEALKKAMQDLIDGLKERIPRVLAGPDCQHRKARCLDQYQRREQRLIAQLEARLAPSFGLIWPGLDTTAVPEVAPVIEGRLASMGELEERVDSGRLRRCPLPRFARPAGNAERGKRRRAGRNGRIAAEDARGPAHPGTRRGAAGSSARPWRRSRSCLTQRT